MQVVVAVVYMFQVRQALEVLEVVAAEEIHTEIMVPLIQASVAVVVVLEDYLLQGQDVLAWSYDGMLTPIHE